MSNSLLSISPRRALTRAIACACVALLSSCSLIYDYDHCPPEEFAVEFDWEYAPEARPESMSVIFFGEKSPEAWRFDFEGRNGGTVAMPRGNYYAIALNDDCGSNLLSRPDAGPDELRLTTPCQTLWPGGPDRVDGLPVHACPGQVWAEAANGVEVAPGLTRIFKPRRSMARYDFEISGIKNLAGAKRLVASISGMASEFRFASGHRGGQPVALALGAAPLGSSTVGGEFLTIGAAQGTDQTLRLYVWLTDGRQMKFAFDVSGQVRLAPDPMNVSLRVGGIDLPEVEPEPEGAFDVKVDGWNTEIIDIDHNF